MNRACVSVVIPTFNRANTLPRAIDSVVAQTFADWELVVVDDGSTDGTTEVLAHYQKKLRGRFLWARQKNRGCSAARNQGIELAKGNYIAFLDSDDEFLPNKLSRQRELFAALPQLSFVYSDYSFVDLHGRQAESALAAKFPHARNVTARHVGDKLWLMGADLFDVLLRGYFIATIVGMVRREALATIRFDERISYAEEWLFYLQLARSGRAGFVDEPLARHYFTPDSLTRSDKSRNLARRCQLFQVMCDIFSDIDTRQKAVLLGHLRNACCDLAAHRRSLGQWMSAASWSARATWYGYKQHAATRSNNQRENAADALRTDQACSLPAR